MKNIYTFSLIFAIGFLMSCNNFNNHNKSEKNRVKYSVNKDGDTVRSIYSPEGILQTSIAYKNGLKNGPAYSYYKNGKVKLEVMYRYQVKDGMAKYYYESGKLYRETHYVDGQKDGYQKKYYENGRLMAEIPYKAGEVVMGTKEYTSSGKLITKYPKISVVPIDRLASENTYYLKISLKPHKSKARFFLYRGPIHHKVKIDLRNYKKNGVVKYPVKVYPGRSVMEKIEIRVFFMTRKRNPMVIHRYFNLAVENRSY